MNLCKVLSHYYDVIVDSHFVDVITPIIIMVPYRVFSILGKLYHKFSGLSAFPLHAFKPAFDSAGNEKQKTVTGKSHEWRLENEIKLDNGLYLHIWIYGIMEMPKYQCLKILKYRNVHMCIQG